MPIKFDEFGNPYPYKEVCLTKQRFSDIFTQIPDVTIRRTLFNNFCDYLKDLKNVVSLKQWFQYINGSYTTKKENPSDIDVVSFVDEDSYRVIVSHERLLSSPTAKNDSRNVYRIDAYFVPEFMTTDPRYKIYLDKISYWAKWFGYDRIKKPKALIRIDH